VYSDGHVGMTTAPFSIPNTTNERLFQVRVRR
jgi:hypothetical protein